MKTRFHKRFALIASALLVVGCQAAPPAVPPSGSPPPVTTNPVKSPPPSSETKYPPELAPLMAYGGKVMAISDTIDKSNEEVKKDLKEVFDNTNLLSDAGWKSRIKTDLTKMRSAADELAAIQPVPKEMKSANDDYQKSAAVLQQFTRDLSAGIDAGNTHQMETSKKGLEEYEALYSKGADKMNDYLEKAAKKYSP